MTDRLVWIDCEMTGLDLERDALIEVAALVTDSDLNILGDGVDVVIHAGDELLDSMVDVVREMHAQSGLTEAVRASKVTLAEAEERVLGYVRRHAAEPKSAPLCGNSIATDRGFLARDMPALDSHLHYRMVDVSSIKELCRRWYPRVYFGQPAKGLEHRALADIKESIRELAYYRQTIFVPLPGPDVDAAKAVAAELVAGEQAAVEHTTGQEATDGQAAAEPVVPGRASAEPVYGGLGAAEPVHGEPADGEPADGEPAPAREAGPPSPA